MAKLKVYVLRLGHREVRDKRVTTHLFLAARAFGADRVIYSGRRDEKLGESIEKIVETWGGVFEIEYQKDWRKTVKDWKSQDGEVIHLTMYGLPIQEVIAAIRQSHRDRLVVVGGAKVHGDVFELADWNVSVTSQPHSEISALCIFLHELFKGKELARTFENAEKRIVPQAKGKKVMRRKSGKFRPN
ncbi:MAG: tRNA (cytidine(56)-2'-O)-methyltransferase [Candidatus Bathyarchaeia archaeon]